MITFVKIFLEQHDSSKISKKLLRSGKIWNKGTVLRSGKDAEKQLHFNKAIRAKI